MVAIEEAENNKPNKGYANEEIHNKPLDDIVAFTAFTSLTLITSVLTLTDTITDLTHWNFLPIFTFPLGYSKNTLTFATEIVQIRIRIRSVASRLQIVEIESKGSEPVSFEIQINDIILLRGDFKNLQSMVVQKKTAGSRRNFFATGPNFISDSGDQNAVAEYYQIRMELCWNFAGIS